MRLSKHRRRTLAEMNMTPMIDIVFLLIIFFMTVSQISEINKELMELPKLQGSEDQQRSSLTINITRAGELIVSGNKTTKIQLMGIVTQELAKVNDDPSRLSVVVRADERGDCRVVNEVMNALGKLQLVKVRLAVQVPE
jgi:biopolymer transport protein ExbD